jgi:hypothetical protein
MSDVRAEFFAALAAQAPVDPAPSLPDVAWSSRQTGALRLAALAALDGLGVGPSCRRLLAEFGWPRWPKCGSTCRAGQDRVPPALWEAALAEGGLPPGNRYVQGARPAAEQPSRLVCCLVLGDDPRGAYVYAGSGGGRDANGEWHLGSGGYSRTCPDLAGDVARAALELVAPAERGRIVAVALRLAYDADFVRRARGERPAG